jgi:transposase
MRLRNDLLAPSARLARSGGVGQHLAGVAGRAGAGRWDRLVVSRHRQLFDACAFWGDKTGPNPTDRAKNGSKRHLITDGNGTPLAIKHTGANVHDSQMAIPLVDAIEPIARPRGRPRKRPEVVLADRAYDAQEKIREPLRNRGITARIAKRNAGHGSGLGKYRWVVEAAFAWLFQYRRLRVRYEKRDDIHQAFLNIGCLLICWHRVSEWVFC